jgi:uncharacterized protein (TIGR00725 family)
MYQICVSGAHNGHSVDDGKELAAELGKAIAVSGHTLLTGATIGLPNLTAEAYKAAGGQMSVGISPASSKIEHVMKYRLPIQAYDAIIYTGMHYVGRDAFLIGSSDAVISLGGRMGTFHEFAISVETDTPIGFLMGAGGISTEIPRILEATGEDKNKHVVFGDTADEVLKKLLVILDAERLRYKDLYS